MNLVLLTGRLGYAAEPGTPLEPGWSRLALKVPRRGPYHRDEPGVLTVVLLLPPPVAASARGSLTLSQWVIVSGLLETDTDRSRGISEAHHTVIAEMIEPVPPDEAAHDARLQSV
jgi:hypothetical protein